MSAVDPSLRLYTDVLGVVMAFLSVLDRVQLTRVSRGWRNLSESGPAIDIFAKTHQHVDVIALSSSGLAQRHLVLLEMQEGEYRTMNEHEVLKALEKFRRLQHLTWSDSNVPLSSFPLFSKLEHLRKLHVVRPNEWTRNTHFLKALLVPGFALPHLEDVGAFVADDDAFCRQVCTFLPKLCNLDISVEDPFVDIVEINSGFHVLNHIRRVAIRPTCTFGRFNMFSRQSVQCIRTHRLHEFVLFNSNGVAPSLFDWLSEVHCLSKTKFVACELVDCTQFSHATLLEWTVSKCTSPAGNNLYRQRFNPNIHGPKPSNCPRAAFIELEHDPFWIASKNMVSRSRSRI
jgi:hypothetical protein